MVRERVGSMIAVERHSYGTLRCLGVGQRQNGQILALQSSLWTISDRENDVKTRNPLENQEILNTRQIGVGICPLAVLSDKGHELWARCCDGAR